MPENELDGLHRTVVVVGGGQAGLSVSHCLTRHGVDHIVLERHRIAHSWRANRWDTFCLVTPNWQCELPGFPYSGGDPHGFMVKDEILEYLDAYAKSFAPPVFEGVSVNRLRADDLGRFVVGTSHGTLTAEQVVVATGPYQVPRTPRLAERLPDSITQLHSADYRNPARLPAGAVLVVGTGQSGCQIAEDLHLAGRQVHLATGSAPRVARFYRGRDVVDWLADMGYYRRSIDEFADAEAVRLRANHYVTGRDGGRDIDLRAFAVQGMRLYGRLTAISGSLVSFGDDLKSNLDSADAVSDSIKTTIDEYITATGADAPAEPRYRPVWEPLPDAPTTVDLAGQGISAVIWCTGYGRDHRWIDLPVFDGKGYPTHHRGVTAYPGLYFVGLPWQWTWGSGRFSGVAADAEYLASRIVGRRPGPPSHDVRWIAGTPASTYPRDDDWLAPRTVA